MMKNKIICNMSSYVPVIFLDDRLAYANYGVWKDYGVYKSAV